MDVPSTTATIQVVDLRINDSIDQEVFTAPEYAPGSLGRATTGSFEQMTPNGHDQMDRVAKYLQQDGYFKENRLAGSNETTKTTPMNYAIGIGLVGILLCGWIYYRRTWRTPESLTTGIVGQSAAVSDKSNEF